MSNLREETYPIHYFGRSSALRGLTKSGRHVGDTAKSLPCLDHGILAATVLVHRHVVEHEKGEEITILCHFLFSHAEVKFLTQFSRFLLVENIVTEISQHWIGLEKSVLP